MVYAYDNWVQLPTRDLYDTQVMAMAINAAKDMYEKGQQEMKDFRKEYGDFMTPIAADQAWYDQNVTGKIRDTINALYAQGIDPLRNAQGRAMISQAINSMPYGDIAKLRMSAANAQEYLKARQKLEIEGKYNPLMEQYAGIGLGQFSTVDNGVWDRMSPVPYQNMSEFSKAYFDNISPMQRQATKNGINYTVSEVTEPMLQDIANRHFNDLVNTPQGQLMYKMYKDQLGSDELARQAFNDAVVSGNLDRRKYADDYDKMELENKKLAIENAKLAVQRERLKVARDAAARKQKNDEAKSWTHRQMTNIMLNHKLKKELIMDLANAKSGSTASGAKMQLIGEGISNPTKQQIEAKIAENKKKLLNQDIYAQNYALYTTNVTGGDKITAQSLFAGLSKDEAIADLEGTKRKHVQFGPNSDLSVRSLVEQAYGGVKLANTGSQKLQNYLTKNHVSGYVPGEDVSVSYKDIANGVGRYDINSTIRINAKDLEGLDKNSQTRVNILAKSGATLVDKQGKVITKQGKIAWDTIQCVDIPSTRTIDSKGYIDSEIDTYHEALNFTKTTAKKRQGEFEDDDETDLMDYIYGE